MHRIETNNKQTNNNNNNTIRNKQEQTALEFYFVFALWYSVHYITKEQNAIENSIRKKQT